MNATQKRVGLFGRSALVGALMLAVAACGGGNDVLSDAGAVPDGGGTCFPLPTDDDGDGISDIDEGRAQGRDTDMDGTEDWEDADSDGDGIPDADEAGDSDACTVPV